MKFTKRMLIGTLLSIVFLVDMASPVLGYSYAGYKWQSGSVNYQIDSYTVPYAWENSIYAARGTWNAASKFRFYQATSNYQIHYASLGDSSLLGLTNVVYSGSQISSCTETLNSDKGALWSTSGDSIHYDVQSVALHEFGHWLSLDHSAYTSAVMYPTLNLGQVKRSLTSDDLAGIRYIYGV